MISIKPSNYNYNLEISPLNLFKYMKEQFILPKGKMNSNYLSLRISIIKNLQYITNKLKFRRQTFFLALFYLDLIFSKINVELKPELAGLTCLILAGKNNL